MLGKAAVGIKQPIVTRLAWFHRSSLMAARYQQQQTINRLSVRHRGAAMLQAEQEAKNRLALEAPAVLGRLETEARRKIAMAVAGSGSAPGSVSSPSRPNNSRRRHSKTAIWPATSSHSLSNNNSTTGPITAQHLWQQQQPQCTTAWYDNALHNTTIQQQWNGQQMAGVFCGAAPQAADPCCSQTTAYSNGWCRSVVAEGLDSVEAAVEQASRVRQTAWKYQEGHMPHSIAPQQQQPVGCQQETVEGAATQQVQHVQEPAHCQAECGAQKDSCQWPHHQPQQLVLQPFQGKCRGSIEMLGNISSHPVSTLSREADGMLQPLMHGGDPSLCSMHVVQGHMLLDVTQCADCNSQHTSGCRCSSCDACVTYRPTSPLVQVVSKCHATAKEMLCKVAAFGATDADVMREPLLQAQQ